MKISVQRHALAPSLPLPCWRREEQHPAGPGTVISISSDSQGMIRSIN